MYTLGFIKGALCIFVTICAFLTGIVLNSCQHVLTEKSGSLISQVVHHGKEKSSEDPEVGFSSHCFCFLEGNDDPGF